MKRYIIAIVFALGLVLNVDAQIGQYQQAGSDAFFEATDMMEYRTDDDQWGTFPFMPNLHNGLEDYSAVPSTPLGSGLLLLAGMGLGYAAFRKKD